ncbi:MAG: DUF4405 domain-containing protein [Desulfobacterales bacterium]|nr:DUF4405 domain-containing protein [Desulfobacterales bacterium]
MNMRKITSLTALLSFVVLILNSVILYIMPQGRVAYWADWHLWGLDKPDWGNQHIIIGVLFLIAILLHIYYNWKPIVSYLKNKAKALKFFNKEFNIALIVTIVCVVGSYFTVPPFSWVLDLSESIKDAAGVKYGEPPYGHAELSTLKTLARRSGYDLNQSTEGLTKAGIKFEDENQTLLAIAKLNKIAPQQVYLAMKPAEIIDSATGKPKMPENPMAGTGKRTVASFVQEYGLDMETIIRGLGANNIKATADMNMKTIAEKHNMGPSDIYDLIRKIAESQPAQTPQPSSEAKTESVAALQQDIPTGLGRMTIAEVCQKYNLDQTGALLKLTAKGIPAKPDDKLKELAEAFKLNPSDIYEIMK